MNYKKSNHKGWLSVASNIPTEKINSSGKNCKRKSKSNVYNTLSSNVRAYKSVIKSSFVSSEMDKDIFLDTSNYRQTNISSFLKKKRKKLNKKKSKKYDNCNDQQCSPPTIKDTFKGQLGNPSKNLSFTISKIYKNHTHSMKEIQLKNTFTQETKLFKCN